MRISIIRNKGFTLIELITAVVLLGIIVVPLAIMAVEFTRSTVTSRNLMVATGLTRLEMSKVNNLDYADASLADGYDSTTSGYEGHQYDVRRRVNYVADSENNLKKVDINVYPAGESDFLIGLVTYVADVNFGAGSGGGAPGTGAQAEAFSLSEGRISVSRLLDLTLTNNGASEITITAATVTWTGSSGIALEEIKLDDVTRWSGSESSSPAAVTFTTAFILDASTSYSKKSDLYFSTVLSTVSVTFTFADDSTSEVYSWP